MSKEHVIQMIRRHNRHASLSYLANFDEQSLAEYLARLASMQSESRRSARWVRVGSTPAITGHALR